MRRKNSMPYILSPNIQIDSLGMWGEGHAYTKKSIYSVDSTPPVNYDEHILRPHSLTHLETPAHTIKDGKRLEHFYNTDLSYFYGPTLVIRLKGDKYVKDGNIHHWIISRAELEEALKPYIVPTKVLITTDTYPVNKNGYHDPNYVLTLSLEAAQLLVDLPGFNLYGNSWKSSDFRPGSRERPIHNKIFEKGLILENLNLRIVPEGVYFMCAFPLPLVDASESPVVPVLFSKNELI
jgi:arylformamidase